MNFLQKDVGTLFAHILPVTFFNLKIAEDIPITFHNYIDEQSTRENKIAEIKGISDTSRISTHSSRMQRPAKKSEHNNRTGSTPAFRNGVVDYCSSNNGRDIAVSFFKYLFRVICEFFSKFYDTCYYLW